MNRPICPFTVTNIRNGVTVSQATSHRSDALPLHKQGYAPKATRKRPRLPDGENRFKQLPHTTSIEDELYHPMHFIVAAQTSSKLQQRMCGVAADRGKELDALFNFDPIFAGEHADGATQSRVKSYTLYCQSVHDKELREPYPVTHRKLAGFAAALLAVGCTTADNYVSAVRSFAEKTGQLQMEAHEKLRLSSALARAGRQGKLAHMPATPISLSTIYRNTGYQHTPERAVALFTFYFGLRKAERHQVSLANISTEKVVNPRNSEESVEKFSLDLSGFIQKSNHTKTVAAFCTCYQLREINEDACNLCICKNIYYLKNCTTDYLGTLDWAEVLQEVAPGCGKVHGIRIATLHHLLSLESSVGWTNIISHMRWKALSMIVYYARQRQRFKACKFHSIDFTRPYFNKPGHNTNKAVASILSAVKRIEVTLTKLGIPTGKTRLTHLEIEQLIDNAREADNNDFPWDSCIPPDGHLDEAMFDEDDEEVKKEEIKWHGENFEPIDDSVEVDDSGTITPEG